MSGFFIMSYYTYILQSLKDGRFYFGQTQSLFDRLKKHNKGLSKYTSKFIPWNLIWYRKFGTRKDAYAFEQYLKKLKSRNKIIQLLKENPCVPGSENIQISDLIDFRESS